MVTIGGVGAKKGEIVHGQLEVGDVSIPLILASGEKDGPALCLHCAQHRTEYSGSAMIPRLLETLDLSKVSGTVVILPLVDVPAIHQTRAKEMYPRVAAEMKAHAGTLRSNINRVWPGKPDGSWVERLAHTIAEEVFRKVDLVLDFHACRMSDDCFASYVEGHEASARAAVAFGLRIVDESTTREAIGDNAPPPYPKLGLLHKTIPVVLGTAAILVEASPASRFAHPAMLDRMHAGVRNEMRMLGMIEGEPELPPSQTLFHRADPVNIMRAEAMGFLTLRARTGDVAEESDLLGEVRSLSTFKVQQEFRAPFAGGLPSAGPTESFVVLPGEECLTFKPCGELTGTLDERVAAAMGK